MADTIATVSGVALVPGVSKNNRLYTPEVIKSAVARAQDRIKNGGMPITAMTHHAAGDDSTRIVGRVTNLSVSEDGTARYEMALANTEHARDLLNLIDTSGGQQFLSGVSIRGAWLGPVKKQSYEGQMVEVGDDLELDGLDFTKTPGVDGVTIDGVRRSGKTRESDGRALIFESVDRAVIVEATDMEHGRKNDNDADDMEDMAAMEDMVEDYAEAVVPGHRFTNDMSRCECMPAREDMGMESDYEANTKPYGNVTYADPGYQSDGVKRYPVDSAAHVRAAWSYINMPKNASKYSASQLKRVKSRIISAAKKYGITINAKENYLSTEAFKVTENAGVVPGGVPLFKEDPYAMPPLAGFCVALNNRCFDVVVSSHMIDPADLEMIGHKAMAAACAAVATLDPDMDGDIDALGDDDDDDDDDSPQMKNAMDGMESCPVCNVPGCTCGPGCVCPPDASQHCGMGAESAPQTPTAQAAGDTTEEEAPAMAEETQTPEATETAAPSAVEAKLDALIAAIGGLAEKLTPAATESAPAAPVAEAEVAETEEARIERLVAEKLTEAVQAHVAKNGVERKGLVKEAAVGAPLDSFNAGEHELPEGWPQKPLHQYTREEQMRYLNPALEQAIMGRRSVYREQ